LLLQPPSSDALLYAKVEARKILVFVIGRTNRQS